MYNIQKAVSRLPFAPKLKEIQVTDITKGLGVFTPQPDKPVSFAALQTALKKAGYTLDTAEINVVGMLTRDDKGVWLVADRTGQRFALVAGPALERLLTGVAPDARVEIVGDWQTVKAGVEARETISPREIKQVEGLPEETIERVAFAPAPPAVRFAPARFAFTMPAATVAALPLPHAAAAPIRTTSPGLTVYQGGAVIPRLSFVRQHLGALVVRRQQFNLSFTYTPTATLQLEAELPVTRTAYAGRGTSGANTGLGNVTLWGKYRFYRRVKTYGDRQAAARFGLELPTGKKTGPRPQQLAATDFVRAQLTPINGGFAPTGELAYAQAVRRFVFGANVAGTLRTERAGFRTGHELRINTDTELVIFPFKYRRPVRELFAILETNFVRRGLGHSNGQTVRASSATEYYLSPGLQYVATPQLIVEASAQLPVVRRTGAQLLRTDHNFLFALHYLF